MKCEKYMTMLVTKRQVFDVNTGNFKKNPTMHCLGISNHAQ